MVVADLLDTVVPCARSGFVLFRRRRWRGSGAEGRADIDHRAGELSQGAAEVRRRCGDDVGVGLAVGDDLRVSLRQPETELPAPCRAPTAPAWSSACRTGERWCSCG